MPTLSAVIGPEHHTTAMKPNALHIVAGLAKSYGGPSYSVPRLCEALAKCGAAISLLSVEDSREKSNDTKAPGYEDIRFLHDFASVPGICALRLSVSLSKMLHNTASNADIIHTHGLWLAPNIYAARAAARSGKPFVVSPRGMLSPTALSYSRLRKKIFWKTFQKKAIHNVACFHATSDSEYEDVRSLGLANPVAVIPNGVDIPEISKSISASHPSERILLALGRIHPKKGFDRLLQAWKKVEENFPDWRLRVAGPAELEHDKVLQALARSLDLRRVTLEGAIYGDEKNTAYREAELFVLPSLNENFGLTVAESLASGTPVLSTKGAPWSGLESEGCGWWVDKEIESLTAALSGAMSMPRETLRSMGAKGRAWMERDFSWESVATEMLRVYEWLVAGGRAPTTVRCD